MPLFFIPGMKSNKQQHKVTNRGVQLARRGWDSNCGPQPVPEARVKPQLHTCLQQSKC